MWMYSLIQSRLFSQFSSWKVNWLYVLLYLLCALPPNVPAWSAKTVKWGCIDSIQTLFSVLVMKSQLTLCSTLSTLAASSSRLLCSSSKRACMVRQDCSNVDVLIDSIQTLFAVLVMKSQLTLCSTLSTLAASSSRLLCSSSKRACMVRQDCKMWMYWFNPDSFRSSCHEKSTDSMFYIYSSSLFLAASVLFLQTCLHVSFKNNVKKSKNDQWKTYPCIESLEPAQNETFLEPYKSIVRLTLTQYILQTVYTFIHIHMSWQFTLNLKPDLRPSWEDCPTKHDSVVYPS